MNNIIVAADQNNSLYFFNKSDGVIKKQIPTEEVSLKNNYINSMALNKDGLFSVYNQCYYETYCAEDESTKCVIMDDEGEAKDIYKAKDIYEAQLR